MVRSKRFGPRKLGLKRPNKVKKARVSKPLRAAVKAIVRGQAETKYTNWYSSVNDGTSTTKATGFFSASGWAAQNQSITNNTTDILRLIPTVIEGTGDTQRIGSRIRPVSFTLKGSMRIRNVLINSPLTVTTNFTVDLYVLQHRRLKDYANLYTQNVFSDLLENGEGGTVNYTGIAVNRGMRVSSSNYIVLARKRITLRYGGVTAGAAGPTNPYCISNAHTFYADYSMNLTKHLPKVLQYPDAATGTNVVPPVVLNAPTNSAIFLCMGYPSWFNDITNSTAAAAGNSFMEQTYVTELGFKDM